MRNKTKGRGSGPVSSLKHLIYILVYTIRSHNQSTGVWRIYQLAGTVWPHMRWWAPALPTNAQGVGPHCPAFDRSGSALRTAKSRPKEHWPAPVDARV